jgi:hypothetical protein
VELGRIHVRGARPVLGRVPEIFELKRAPSRPPRLRPGSRVVLILTGARSPYLLVSTADEIIPVPDAGTERTWTKALRALDAVKDRPARLEELYFAWLIGAEEALRPAASLGLRDSEAAFRPLSAQRVASLVDLATDAALTPTRRRAAAEVAASQREGADSLLMRLPRPADEADALLLSDTLRRGALLRSGQVTPALARCLTHPRPEIRRAALRFGSLLTADEAGRAELERVAQEDPVPEIQQAAARVLDERRSRR